MRGLLLVVAIPLFSACTQRTLDVAKDGAGDGVISDGSGAIDCGATCAAPMPQAPITLTATPDDDSDFTGWSCAFYEAVGAAEPLTSRTGLEPEMKLGDPIASPNGPVPFDRVGQAKCTATFTSEPLLTVVVVGPGSVTGADGAIDCGADCDETVDRGASVTLTATAGDSEFLGWSGACTGVGTTTTIEVEGSGTCTATFVDPADLATVTLVVEGEGSFTSTPLGIAGGIEACSADGGLCTGRFPIDSTVTLNATLPDGYAVQSWSAGCEGGSIDVADDITCTVVVLPPPATVQWNVFLTKSGGGTGAVTSSPAGIDCGTACANDDATIPDATTVTLTAAGATFAGFTCGCSFSGVAPNVVSCGITGGTGTGDLTTTVVLNGLDDARGADVIVRLDCDAAF